MKFLVLLFLVISDSTLITKGSRVDVALETVLEIDKSVGKLFMKELHSAIDDIVGDVNRRSQRKHIPKAPYKYEFSQFLKDAIDITNTLDDEKLIELIGIVTDELDLVDSREREKDRRHFNKKIEATKNKQDKIRRSLDNLLKSLRSDNKDSKGNLLSNIIRALYERNSKQKILNTMKYLKIFSKSKTDNKLIKSIKKSIRTVISNINLKGNKYGQLRTFLDDLVKDNDDNSNMKPNHVRIKLKRNRKTRNKKEPTRQTVSKKRYITTKNKNKVSRYTTKQTYMTLYPESIHFINESKYETFNDKSSKPESDDDQNSPNVESETNEVHRSTNEVEIDGEKVKNKRIKTHEIESEGVKVKRDRRKDKHKKYEKARASKKFIDTKTSKRIKKSYKTKQPYESQNTKTTKWDVIEKDIIWSTSKSSESLESFGNLYKQTETDDEETTKRHKTKHTTNKSEKTIKTTKAKVIRNRAFSFRNNYRRLADNNNYHTKIDYTTTKLPTSNILVNITSVSHITTKDLPKTEDLPKSTIREMANVNNTELINTKNFDTTKEIKYINKTNENIMKEEENSTFKSPVFDINSYIKNSDIKDIKDVDKKNEIERKMKEDLNEIFNISPNTSTTDSYTDIFKDLEDEFDLR